jgi:hypothetical protein
MSNRSINIQKHSPFERIGMFASYLVDAGLLSPNELDAAQVLVRSEMARGGSLAVGDALVQLRIISAPVLMALTFLYQIDQTDSPQTATMLERHLLQSGALTAEEIAQARAAQDQAQVRGRKLSLGAALVRYCNLSLQVLDQRLVSPPSATDTTEDRG